MVTIIIFWAALFCLIFFLLGTLFKGLASLFSGFISSLVTVIVYAITAVLGVLLLYGVYSIAKGIRVSGIKEVLGTIAMLVLTLSIIGGLLGGLGAMLLGIVAMVLEGAIDIVSAVLEGAADFCEKAYVRFLMAIIKRLDKC